MAQKFANVIIDISHESVDRTFQYMIPQCMEDDIGAGTPVLVPFGAGNRLRKGYVVEVTSRAEYEIGKIKEIAEIGVDEVPAQSQLIWLAWWMKERYGSTMNQALKTVLPVKQKVRASRSRKITLLVSGEEAKELAQESKRKHYRARERLLEELSKTGELSGEEAFGRLRLSMSTLNPLLEKGIIGMESTDIPRNPVKAGADSANFRPCLNEQQKKITEEFERDYRDGVQRTYLIHGITGSGKTEVYMRLIEFVLGEGRQAIVLIPEIALTYQTVMRFYDRFGDKVSIINSRLSAGERYDQFERAKRGEIRIMIGPRSALFTPFDNLGLIIIDEEHESAYKSEIAPRYHSRDVAIERARMNRASVVLGSATPSVESYGKALAGEYVLFSLNERARQDSRLARASVVDLREELKSGNKSIFSRKLKSMMEERLENKEQIMLFINRRGYANFVSCRSCGEAMKCPHCDVTLKYHGDGTLRCHYCGHITPMPDRCPGCGSPYIAPFGTGTQKIEQMAGKMFPKARILRMDLDTTSRKGGHEKILSTFAAGDADILIGTQMIVKGHDFPGVTLVGVMAADLSLYAPDYSCGERTFQLLCQAAGRAGRAAERGDVVIQTYNPKHYSITAAAGQDYLSFYEQEMAYRRLLGYPPVLRLLTVQLSSRSQDRLTAAMNRVFETVKPLEGRDGVIVIGPAEAAVYKVNDIYRKILYIKNENYDILIKIKNRLEETAKGQDIFKSVMIQYDFS